MGTIVVGVDGSEVAVRALRFALAEARLRGADVKAVAAWHVPPAVYGTGWAPVAPDFDMFREVAESALDKSIEEVGAESQGVSVTKLVSEGHPAEVLLEASRDAELLVVGSRGLGGFRGLLLGSVGQQCVHHATCPVVVVPSQERNAPEGS